MSMVAGELPYDPEIIYSLQVFIDSHDTGNFSLN